MLVSGRVFVFAVTVSSVWCNWLGMMMVKNQGLSMRNHVRLQKHQGAGSSGGGGHLIGTIPQLVPICK